MITIHSQRGQRMTDLARHLLDLAGGDASAVMAHSNGLTVSDELGLTYLTGLLDDPGAAGSGFSRAPASDALSALIRDVEGRGGLTRPVPSTKPATQTRPRKRAGLARTEEQVHG